MKFGELRESTVVLLTVHNNTVTQIRTAARGARKQED